MNVSISGWNWVMRRIDQGTVPAPTIDSAASLAR